MRHATDPRAAAARHLGIWRSNRAEWQRPYQLLDLAAHTCRAEACRLLLGKGSAAWQTPREALADARVYAAAAELLSERFNRALGLE